MIWIRWFAVPAVIVMCACSMRSAPGQSPADDAPEIPAQDEILGTLRDEHPRLLVAPGDLEALRASIADDPILSDWAKRLGERADGMLEAPPSQYEIPDGKRLLATSRRVLDRVYTLAMTYHLCGGDERYLQRAWTELEAAAQFKDWNPGHFLDTAEMTHAFAIGYDWLYHEWTEARRDVLREAIITHGLRVALDSYRGEGRYGWWVRSHHNWNQVCNGGIAAGALAIADEEPELAAEIIRGGLISLRRAMSHFAPDGAWSEGPGYWNYATSYNVMHLAALQSALGTDFGFSQYEGFDRTGPTGRTFNFADGSDRAVSAAQLFWLGRTFGRPLYSRYQRAHARPTALDVLWYDEQAIAPGEDDEALDRYFRGPEVVTMRSARDDAGALFIGFKAGDNKVNHSHLDPGTFVLDALGERWALDLGGDNYNLPAYFGGKRWTYYRLRAEGHNTLLLNPGEGPDQDPRAATKIVRTGFTPQRAFAIADLTPAYAGQASSVKRGIALINDRSRVLIQDEVRAKQPAELWWFMHTQASVDVVDDGRSAILSRGGKRLLARLLEPAEAVFTVIDAAPLPSSPNPDGQKVNKGIRKLAIHLENIAEVRIAVLLTPLQADEEPRELSGAVVPLVDW
jgi:hypothetical protein